MKTRTSRLTFGAILAVLAFTLALTSAGRADGGHTVYLPLVLSNQGAPMLAGCPMFPVDNIWNRRIDSLPVHSRSSAYVNSIGYNTSLHADIGVAYGIPFTSVPGNQPKVPVSFYYSAESDPGPYPIPPDAPVEGGSDRHVLVVDRDACILYEMFDAVKQPDGSWNAGSGAIFDLRSHALRPAGWTSADAAGLPILPGLVRYDEVAAGAIRHAIRFTARNTQRAYVWPARHFASDITNQNVPPMGARFRLKASKDIGGYPPEIRVIFQAFKEYGIILADNGSNWYITGASDPRWNDEMLADAFKTLKGSDFEAVDVSSLMINVNSGQSR